MSKLKQRLALAVIVVMALGLAACGNSNATPKEETPQQLVEKVAAQLTDIASMDAVMDMDMTLEIKAEGETQLLETVSTANISSTQDPIAMKMDMTMNMNVAGQEQAIDMEIYAVEEAGSFVTYTKMFDMWQKQTVSAEQQEAMLQQYDAQGNLNIYLENAETFTKVSTEELDGVEVYRLEGVLTGDSLQKAIEASGALSQLTQLTGGESEDAAAELATAMFKDLDDMPIVIWANKADLMPVRYEMDMAKVMQKMMSNMFETLSEASDEPLPEDFAMNCSVFKITMNLTNINNTAPIEVPQEALDTAIGA